MTILYFNQEKLIFFNEPLPADHVFRDGRELFIPVDERINLNCLALEVDNPKGTVIYLHGNKGNNRRCLRQAYNVMPQGYNLIMPDYRGFGKSGGVPQSEEQMLSDMQKVYDYVRDKIDGNNIIIVGYSLGSGMASFLAENNKAEHLFLLAPYTSMSDVKDARYVPVPDFLMKYDFDTDERIANIDCPVTIFHSPNDEVIPYKCSVDIKKRHNKVEFLTIPNVGHRGLIFSDIVSSTIQDRINS